MKQTKTANDLQPQAMVSVNSLPEFLVEAKNAVEAGDLVKVESILCENAVERVCDIQDVGSRVLALYMLASLFRKINQLDLAEKWNKKILEYGEYSFAYNELIGICKDRCDFVEAVEYGSKALSFDPDNPKLLSAQGNGLILTSRIDEGVAMLRRAVEIAPQDAGIGTWLLYGLHYKPDITPQILFEEHKKWVKRHVPTTTVGASYGNLIDPDKKLRIGYISPNFRRHSVMYFFEPLLECHNRATVEIYGYSNSETTDSLTERMRPQFDNFSDINEMTDEKIAKMIIRDKIDILVDLAGHTSNNSLLVMARRPAPIQVTYLGYPDTTGLEQIDYRITDELADPPKLHKYYTEEQVCLPDGFLCYRPPEFAPALIESPWIKNGYITFGSFNINAKVNLDVIAIWARVLKGTENSHLLLKLEGGDCEQLQDHYRNLFQQLGIERDRIEICGRKSAVKHLAMYGQVDISLDSYPYHGTTTTCEALWMGVPIISLLGDHHSCRVALSLLKRLDLDYFVASSQEEYVAKACALAAKPDALARIRSTMRARMAASDLCNGKLIAANIETAYRKMWRKYCKSQTNNAY
ncbi:MAG: hypothetical protein FVQ82_14060 [Planctomycetes bacterium]|nr:hypothetical protein [Planctomycetota bacterium]